MDISHSNSKSDLEKRVSRLEEALRHPYLAQKKQENPWTKVLKNLFTLLLFGAVVAYIVFAVAYMTVGFLIRT